MPLSYNDEKRHSKNRRWLYKLGQVMKERAGKGLPSIKPSEKAAISALTEIVRTGNREIREQQEQTIQVTVQEYSADILKKALQKKAKESEEEEYGDPRG
jgi:hypothetical protein